MLDPALLGNYLLNNHDHNHYNYVCLPWSEYFITKQCIEQKSISFVLFELELESLSQVNVHVTFHLVKYPFCKCIVHYYMLYPV